MAYTQTQFDTEVINLQAGIGDFTLRVIRLTKFGDRDKHRMQHMLMRLIICRNCLIGYDISSAILSDDNIDYILGQAFKILQHCP